MQIYAVYYVNQTCDEIEIGLVGKWKLSSFERCNFCFHTMYSLKDIAFKTTPLKIDTFRPDENELNIRKR
jgi:hypothetical protein